MKPNIILVNCDDLGYGDIGCYGASWHKTPALDRMASEGVRFTDFYMAASLCTPSRGAMMTGCYPRRIGFDNFDGDFVLFPGSAYGLHPEEHTVASLLKAQGYATKLVGKWHCGDQPEFLPTRHGFDEYYGLPFSNDMGTRVGRPELPPLPLMDGEDVIEEQPDQASLTERYVEQSVRFIRKNRDQPFFLYLAHLYVHVPLFAPERFMAQSENGPYGAAVECVDWAMAALFAELRKQGLDRNTLVLFTSDNGSDLWAGGSNDPLRGAKGSSWEGGFRVPFIAWWPGTIPAGATCSEMATAMDLLPTLLALAGSDVPKDRTIDGRNIASLLRGESGAATPHDAFYYYTPRGLDAVRSGKWKLFENRYDRKAKEPRSVCELYDLHADIGETRNVAAQHPDIVTALKARLAAAREDLGDPATGAEGKDRRPVGVVAQPVSLTRHDPSHPYMIAMYDATPARAKPSSGGPSTP